MCVQVEERVDFGWKMYRNEGIWCRDVYVSGRHVRGRQQIGAVV